MTDLELRSLAVAPVDFSGYSLGQPQRAGVLTVVPVFGPAYPGITPPRSGIKLHRVDGYGTVELTNPAAGGVAIVPLHMGYIQDQAQNHALCRSAFLASGQTLRFTDAACVQASQGGYLAGRDQWFFVLPVELREAALASRGTADYAKLWPAIAELNRRYGLPARGHLEQVLSGQRAQLNQYLNRLELLPGQLGALFFLGQRLAGIELAPDPRYFEEMWLALACFAYGAAAWNARVTEPEPEPFAAESLEALRGALVASRAATVERVRGWLAQVPAERATLVDEERYLDLRLSTVVGGPLGGQLVTDGDRLVYASMFAREIPQIT